MADRVAFFGGSVVGIDHFPVGFFVGSTITPAYPVAFNAASLCWAYWIVKAWRVHGSVTRTTIGGSTSVSFDWNAVMGDGEDDFGIVPSTLTREAELVVGHSINSNENMGDPAGGQVQVLMFPTFIMPGGTEIRPLIIFTLYAGGSLGHFVTTQSSLIGGAVSVGITAKIIIQGVDKFLTFYTDPSDGATYGGTFTVEPAEYWPYATKAGLPVYNTTTGAQINDPLS